MTDPDPNPECQSIWSVPLGRIAQYFALFTLLSALGLAFLLWYEIFENTAGAAGTSLQIIEGPKFIMVLADYFTKKWLNPLKEQLREEGREQGREEGREQGREEAAAQVNAQWRDWLRRRTEAEAKGEPFDEPPPSAAAPEDAAD